MSPIPLFSKLQTPGRPDTHHNMSDKDTPPEPSLAHIVKLIGDMDKKLETKVDSVKADLEKSIRDQAVNIEQSV